MHDSSDSQPIGEIVSPPPSVQINAPQLTGSAQAPVMGQPTMQQNVVYIQMPKFKHPTRMYSYLLIVVGTLIFWLIGILSSNSNEFQLGCGICCMFYNAAFVCEILFYYNMMEHNQSYGKGTGWAVINIVLGAILTVIGLYIAFGIFTSSFDFSYF
jgi:hypothetical protein